MSFITTKFHEILLSGFRGVALTNCFSIIFHFGQISKFKKGVTLRKKIESKFPVDMHIYTLRPSELPSFTKFCWAVSEELRWQENQDWWTDWLTDGSKTLYSATRCVGYKYVSMQTLLTPHRWGDKCMGVKCIIQNNTSHVNHTDKRWPKSCLHLKPWI